MSFYLNVKKIFYEIFKSFLLLISHVLLLSIINKNLHAILTWSSPTLSMSSKKEERFQKKERKIKALIDVIKLNNEDEPQNKRTKTSNIISDTLNTDTNDIKELKKVLKDRNRKSRPPKFSLKQLGENAHLDCDPNKRTPIFISDIPNLLHRVLSKAEDFEDDWPWYKLENRHNISHTVVLVVEGLSLFHFQTYPNSFERCFINFETKVEIVLPPYKGKDELIEEIISFPLSYSQKKNLFENSNSLEEAKTHIQKNPTYLSKSIFQIAAETVSDASLPAPDAFPRTHLLLSPIQMICEQYPFPMQGLLHHRYKTYVFTKDVYSEVTPSSPMFGIDCEMVRTYKGILELGRISIVDEDCKPIYESLVRPESVIIDYLTQHSGLSVEVLKDVTKTLKDVQAEVKELLPSDAILVGHSLQNDLTVMKMMHPYVIDTSVIYNLTGMSHIKSKLKLLSERFLNEIIQNDKHHDSIEDAAASLKLVKLKLSKCKEFGDEILKGKKRSNLVYNHLLNLKNPDQKDCGDSAEITGNILHVTNVQNIKTALIASETTNIDHSKYFKKNDNLDYIQSKSNKEAIKNTWELCCDKKLTISHLKINADEFNDSNIDNKLSKIDKMIYRVWEGMKPNGFFIVILGGSTGASTGAALFSIKKLKPNSS